MMMRLDMPRTAMMNTRTMPPSLEKETWVRSICHSPKLTFQRTQVQVKCLAAGCQTAVETMSAGQLLNSLHHSLRMHQSTSSSCVCPFLFISRVASELPSTRRVCRCRRDTLLSVIARVRSRTVPLQRSFAFVGMQDKKRHQVQAAF